MDFITYFTHVTQYIDNNGDLWHIYIAMTTQSNYIEYWYQKEGYGIMDMSHGVEKMQDGDIEYVAELIEKVKDEDKYK